MKIGFIVNPIAGMGGRVALKGTDGEETLKRAIQLGAVPSAELRADAAVQEFLAVAMSHQFLVPSGAMGEILLKKYGISTEVVWKTGKETSSEDTKKAATMMLKKGVGLVIFAGGDGTARDICSVLKNLVPVIGIPAGVKIHSGVYANRPKDAGLLIRSFLLGATKDCIEAEVMDIDEAFFRENAVRAKLYGYMKVPDDRRFMQNRKTSGTGKELYETDAIAAWVVENMKNEAIYLIGSGSTTARVMDRIRLKSTLLGIDAVKNKKLIASDMTESEIITILEMYEKPNRFLLITLIGGQGHIFGRGNQQLSPKVLRMLPEENIIVIAAPSKMTMLFGRSLISDTGDAELDAQYSGYINVITGYAKKTVVKII